MGILGNKDNKKEGKDVNLTTSQAKPIQNTNAQIISIQNDNKSILNQWANSTKSCYNEWTSKACGWCESEQIKQIRNQRKQFATHFCHPLGDFYRTFPSDFTSLKFNVIGKYNEKQRLFGLQALTLLVAISTLKAKTDVGLTRRFLFSIRNSAVTFLLGGLFLVPEIYNPLIKSDF